MTVSRETEQLETYADLLRQWNPRINLVAANSLDALETRHIEDSLQIADHVNAPDHWLDLGSGGGLPAIPLAVRLPQVRFTLIESDARKSVFLRTAARELGLKNVTVLTDRIERLPAQLADMISARALAPLPKLLEYVMHHLADGGQAMLMKGRNWQAEVKEAQHIFHFTLNAISSRTDPDAAILHLKDISYV